MFNSSALLQRILIASVLLLPYLALAEDDKPTLLSEDAIPPKIEEIGTEAANALALSLKTLLVSSLESSGPVDALKFCQQAALPTTEALSKKFGEEITISRTALKVRNPQNEPDKLDKQVLDQLEEILAAGNEALPGKVVAQTSETTYRYYKPLVTLALCLKCHGDPASMPADLQTTLQTLYPEDKATGFAEGDLRGVIRVDIGTSSPQ